MSRLPTVVKAAKKINIFERQTHLILMCACFVLITLSTSKDCLVSLTVWIFVILLGLSPNRTLIFHPLQIFVFNISLITSHNTLIN